MEADKGKRPNITFADVFEHVNMPKNIDKVFEEVKPKLSEKKFVGKMMIFGTSGQLNNNTFKELWEN